MAKPKPQLSQTAQTLVGLGLTENEATLYTLLLTRPPSTVHELAPIAPFPRTLLYHVLNQLVARGLVRVRDDAWRAVYTAEDPARLYDLLADRKKTFDEQSDRVRTLVPKLKRTYQLADTRPQVRMFDGVVEYQKALDNVLASKPTELLAYQNLEQATPAIEIYEQFERTRIAQGISKKLLFCESHAALCALEDIPYNDHTQVRSIAKRDVAPFDGTMFLYDGAMLYTRNAGYEPTALLIQDTALYAMQKSLFMNLWNKAQDRTLYFVDVKRKRP